MPQIAGVEFREKREGLYIAIRSPSSPHVVVSLRPGNGIQWDIDAYHAVTKKRVWHHSGSSPHRLVLLACKKGYLQGVPGVCKG